MTSTDAATPVNAPTTMAVTLTVNGLAVDLPVETRASLADVLRGPLGLTGTNVGCEQGVCGSCTVLVNGVSTRSCLFLGVQADGCRVDTIEGLSPPHGLSAVQQAIADCSGLQCGFCTPGFVVTISELLASGRLAELDEHGIRKELGGNLCRCTGYEGLVDAVLTLRDAPLELAERDLAEKAWEEGLRAPAAAKHR